jgi:hypothetical protein
VSKFNKEAAQKVVDAVREAMKVSKQLDPGRTRHNPNNPSIIKQTECWEVNEKELRQFERVIDLLVCAIFGIDCDGDRSLQWLFVNRATEETRLPFMTVPRVDIEERDEDKYLEQIMAIQANLHAMQEDLERAFRMFQSERHQNKERREREERAKGCDVCKETGFVRCTSEEHEKYIKQREFSSRRHHLRVGRIDCPKCQQPAIKAAYDAMMRDDDDDEPADDAES